jgi:hypothetical protein
MDKIKKMPRRMKGGLIASAITLLVALLTLGVGTAFGAEGGLAALLRQAVGGVAGPATNIADQMTGGFSVNAEGSTDGYQYAILEENGTLSFIRSHAEYSFVDSSGNYDKSKE